MFPRSKWLLICCLPIAVLLCVVFAQSLRLWIILPRHFHEMLEEICSLGPLRLAPVVNPERTRLVYARNVENGVGIYLVDLNSLQSRRLEFAPVNDVDSTAFAHLFGWSPDGKYLGYSLARQPDSSRQHVVLCDGFSGKEINHFEFPLPIRRSLWLTNGTLLLLDDAHQFHWISTMPHKLTLMDGMAELPARLRSDDLTFSLAPVSNSILAYVSHGNIWSIDVVSHQAEQLTCFTNATLRWLDYSLFNDEFLFNLKTATLNEEVCRYNPKTLGRGRPASVSTPLAFKGQWLKDDAGITYVGTTGNVNFLAVSAKNSALCTNLFLDGHVRSYNLDPNRHCAYALASIRDEPLGIWEYDILTRKLREVVPGLERSLIFSELVSPIRKSLVAKGKMVQYFILAPPKLDKNKKYPALISGPRDSRWESGPQFLANVGIFFVSCNNSGMSSSEDFSQAPEDILAVYHELVKNPNVDSRRIYILGISASTAAVAELVDSSSALWRGAAFLSPDQLPNVPTDVKNFPSVYISIGGSDKPERIAEVENFVREARNHHITVQLIRHKTAAHVFATPDLVKERYAALAEFILANR